MREKKRWIKFVLMNQISYSTSKFDRFNPILVNAPSPIFEPSPTSAGDSCIFLFSVQVEVHEIQGSQMLPSHKKQVKVRTNKRQYFFSLFLLMSVVASLMKGWKFVRVPNDVNIEFCLNLFDELQIARSRVDAFFLVLLSCLEVPNKF